MRVRHLALGLIAGLCALGARPAFSERALPRYAADSEGILWFLHLSDTHIGAEWFEVQEDPVVRLEFALGEGVEVIAPSFVVVTGDLVDGSRFGIPTAGQDQAEWDSYQETYTNAGMTPDFYFDVIGNHDLYGDRGGTFYLANSLQGSTHGVAHFSWTRTVAAGEYFFYALNSAGDDVPIFSAGEGEILDSEYDALVAALDASAVARVQFVFAHHPPFGPSNSARVATLLAERGAIYVHGHRHEYLRYLDVDGSLVVVEAASLGKSNGNNIAVGAIDHDGFAYRSTDVGAPWPLVLVTAPLDRYQGAGVDPWSYPVCKDRPDNPVRALVFSKEPPTSVTVQVDGLEPRSLSPSPSQPRLWVGTVDTSPLAAGMHELGVLAVTDSGSDTHTINLELTAGPCAPLSADGGVADGGLPEDGGVEADAGLETDAGVEADAGFEADAGIEADAGTGEDAGAPPADGGMTESDAGSSDPNTPPWVAGAGCACGASGPGAGGVAWLALLCLLWGWRREWKRRAAQRAGGAPPTWSNTEPSRSR